jgi:hypothetical protein
MQLSVTITSLGSALVIQDPNPTNGVFSKAIPANGAKTFDCPWEVWHRISAAVEAHRAAGRCTVALRELTPTGTSGVNGANTTYNRSDWALLNSFRSDITTLQNSISAIGSPLIPKGFIAINTEFPLVASVQGWWTYVVTADVTDNAGATYTNTNLSFLTGDEIAWDSAHATWVKLGPALTSPMQLMGSVTLPADFPTLALVKTGYVYRVLAAVIDNNAARTNTLQNFVAGDNIVWNGTNWTYVGNGTTPEFISVTMKEEHDHGNSGANYTVNWALAQHHFITLTATCTFAFTAPPGTASFLLRTLQGGVGGFGINWPVGTKFAGGTPPVPTALAGSEDLFTVYFNGTGYYVGLALADCKVAP